MRSPAARKDLAALGSVIALTSTLLRARRHRRVLGTTSIGSRGTSRQTRVCLCVRLCASFDPVNRATPMKMRLMRSGALFTFGPFALVATLAVGLALGGYLASPRPTGGGGSSGATAIRPAGARWGTPDATRSPSSKLPSTNDQR